MSKTYRVPPAPPHNEGKTVAAWTLSALVILGCVAVAVGMITSVTLWLYVGVALIVCGLVAGFGLRAAGFGQKARH